MAMQLHCSILRARQHGRRAAGFGVVFVLCGCGAGQDAQPSGEFTGSGGDVADAAPNASGGSTAAGGAVTGGVHTTGGASTGGVGNGGAVTGGASTGGTSTEGTSTEGTSTGGFVTGGAHTGGTSTGGAAPSVGGSLPSTGGAPPATGGTAPSSGGSAPASGGTAPGTGGTDQATGGNGGGSSCGVDPVNPNATQQAKNLLCYLYSICGSKVLSGQQETSWSNPEGDISWYQTNLGKVPAVLGGDYLYPDGTSDRAIAYWKAGGITMIRYHMGAPPNSDTYENSKGSANIDNVLRDGTAENQSFRSKLDYVATELQKLADADVAVLWAPFHEYQPNGWFWWSKGSASQFKELWQTMFDDLTTTQGLNNLVWLASSSGTIDGSWFPGKQTIDIAGPDTYDTHPPFSQIYSQVRNVVGSTVPIPLHETGVVPQPSTMFPSTAPWVLWNLWAGYQTSYNNTPTSHHGVHEVAESADAHFEPVQAEITHRRWVRRIVDSIECAAFDQPAGAAGLVRGRATGRCQAGAAVRNTASARHTLRRERWTGHWVIPVPAGTAGSDSVPSAARLCVRAHARACWRTRGVDTRLALAPSHCPPLPRLRARLNADQLLRTLDGAQTPVHVALPSDATHVWLEAEQSTDPASVQAPVSPQSCTRFPLQCF